VRRSPCSVRWLTLHPTNITNTNPTIKQVRAFGLFMVDLVERIEAASAGAAAARQLAQLAGRCAAVGGGRPRFAEVCDALEAVQI
jgi:hypothetical protein